ncbi:MAG: hypothetical protein ACKOYC_06300 [Bacteroidota bacterium]
MNRYMRLMATVILLMLTSWRSSNAQDGLKGLVVEKYYVTDSSDARLSKTKNLPEGSVTYRVFVDMKPGYQFQACFGSDGHPLKISTTTSFYNHPVYGNNIATLIYDATLSGGTCMLDSWLSTGAASAVHYGIMKADDDTLGTIINALGALKNHDETTGLPINTHDGLLRVTPGTPVPKVTAMGIDELLDALKSTESSSNGFEFKTENGTWACMGGSSLERNGSNSVLIGQFTTSGVFSFQLNIQLGKPGGGFEQYVASDPDPGQFVSPTLRFTSR